MHALVAVLGKGGSRLNQAEAAAPSSDELATCDREPIHAPGRIQSHGLLFFVDRESFRVLQASANCEAALNARMETIIGSPLDSVLG